MLSIILTWIGAILGIAVLLAMAFGAFVLDFDDTRGRRERDEQSQQPQRGCEQR
ncbi:hypothetical protein SacmaDRAFT_0324 [Saccharomonospora marina XMU15]|uniref:Uncharacterized protein n=1 Tax=Saccharomonospora marina XMU15 TaxID=882083 RepID=H5X1A7_9PSEU|nr:hypothetical protein [Saccharomonospora marina]EHR48631.1 hypothetical protein SacmaDRAFT_0324 [Saccharomonospora marina XMU15]